MADQNTCIKIKDKPDSKCLRKFNSCRWNVAFMLCLLRMCQTALRQCIGMALVCMATRPLSSCSTGNGSHAEEIHSVNASIMAELQAADQRNGSIGGAEYSVLQNNEALVQRGSEANSLNASDAFASCSTGDREFLWDSSFEGVVLSSYYYGYLLTPLLASYLDRAVGSKKIVAASVGLGALVNLLTPELTRIHQYLLVALRVIAGMSNGMIDPAIQSLWAAWAPKSEIAYLTAVEYAGVSIGGIFTFLVSGLLCQIPINNGWPFVFYFYGVTSTIWVVAWMVLVYNTPTDHPRMSEEELKFISSETQTVYNRRQINPPWLKMLSSPAVWAIIISSTTFMWVYSWVLCYLPMYLQDVLLYNITQNALLSSLPFVGKFLTGLMCGYLADRLLRTKMSVSCNRKMFQMIGSVGCGACTVVIGFLDYNSRKLAVALLILAVAMQNITTVAFRINALDVAPRYASFILGLANTVAVAASLTGPLITSAVVSDKTREQWQIMFYVVAGLSIIGGLSFLILARATLQDWAKSTDSQCDDTSASDVVNSKSEDSDDLLRENDFHKSEPNNPEIFVPDVTTLQDHELLSTPVGIRRNEHRMANKRIHDLDAVSQWSSSLSLTG